MSRLRSSENFARHFSLFRVVFWASLTPVSYLTGWMNSVAFVSMLSIWALVETSFAAWRADIPNEKEKE